MSDLNYTRKSDGWWITGTWPYTVDDSEVYREYGPYRTKEEVVDAMRAVARTMQTIIDEGLYVGQGQDVPLAAGGEQAVQPLEHQLSLAFV